MKQYPLYHIPPNTESVWINPRLLPFDMTDALCQLIVSNDDIRDADARLARFAPFIRRQFPETAAHNGLIESDLIAIPQMQNALARQSGTSIPGHLLLKADSHLAIAGSVKARGGIYEVLKHAETLARKFGMLSETDDYARFADEDMRRFFGQYTVEVGSTGNLGLSIGLMSAALGFRVNIHMSADAKQWKKDRLRAAGVTVTEYDCDYSAAVAAGRKRSDGDPRSYFVDDEKSVDLFLGYAVAAGRLHAQFRERGITVDDTHPLLVYIPAGVGGAPGGISYGLKRLYRDNVHCFFVEPAQCPSVLLGLATQTFEKANVRDYGLSGKTDADGLACASPSGFVTRLMNNLVSGVFTVPDAQLYTYLHMLNETEQLYIEPSSCAAFTGAANLLKQEASAAYCRAHGLTPQILDNATHLVWATGGMLVPKHIKAEHLKEGLR